METKKWKTVNTKAVINNLNLIFKNRDIDKLNGPTYNFLYLLDGFIAHYDINGFKCAYQDLRKLIDDLSDSSDVRNAERYVNDGFFQKDEYSKDYYKSKTETLVQIKPLVEKYEREIFESFTRLEQRQDIDTIRYLMKKNNLQEVKQCQIK